MSTHQFRNGTGYSVAELDIDASRLHGNGNADYPALIWQLKLSLEQQKPSANDFVFRAVGARLHFASGPKIADALPIDLRRLIRGHQEYWGDEYLNLEFPLDSGRIAALERHRNGGSIKLRLDIQLHVEKYGAIPPHIELNRPVVWGLLELDSLVLQEGFLVTQTDWVERVLPNIGGGRMHILELPAAPIEACAALDHSFKALKQAEDRHRLGYYDDAVGKCRMAIEPFFDHESVDASHPKSRTVPVLKRAWEVKLGKATYEWLSASMGSIKGASNLTHHVPTAHYSQMDSQMIIAITAAVVAYVARAIPLEDLK